MFVSNQSSTKIYLKDMFACGLILINSYTEILKTEVLNLLRKSTVFVYWLMLILFVVLAVGSRFTAERREDVTHFIFCTISMGLIAG